MTAFSRMRFNVILHWLYDMKFIKYLGIGLERCFETEWPPKSPDLTALDYFYWGYLKNKVQKIKHSNIEQLWERIRQYSDMITLEILQKVIDSMYVLLMHYEVSRRSTI